MRALRGCVPTRTRARWSRRPRPNPDVGLEREQDSAVFQLFEAARGEAKQLRRFPSRPPPLAERLQNLEQGDLPPEVPLVEPPPQDRLVHRLQLPECELLGKELEPDGGVFELVAE